MAREPIVKWVAPLCWAVNQIEDIGEGRFALVTISVEGGWHCHLCRNDECADVALVSAREEEIDEDEDRGTKPP